MPIEQRIRARMRDEPIAEIVAALLPTIEGANAAARRRFVRMKRMLFFATASCRRICTASVTPESI